MLILRIEFKADGDAEDIDALEAELDDYQEELEDLQDETNM
jgi:hypothetical protein